MKAAIVNAEGKTPIYGDFAEPIAQPAEELISVRAAALSNLTKSKASVSHYLEPRGAAGNVHSG